MCMSMWSRENREFDEKELGFRAEKTWVQAQTPH